MVRFSKNRTPGIGKRGIPFGFHFIRFWQTVLPFKIFDLFFGKVVGLYHAMDEFKGRKQQITLKSKAS